MENSPNRTQATQTPKISPLESVCIWLAGAGKETLAQCPDWERRKHAAFGATVLIPAAFGFLACALAVGTLTGKQGLIYGIATFWGLMVLTIDRALIASYRPSMPGLQKAVQFSLRLSIAMLIGVTVAHPMVLMLFRDSVNEQIAREHHNGVKVQRGSLEEEISGLENRVAEHQENLLQLRDQLSSIFGSPKNLPKLADPNEKLGAQIARLDHQISEEKAGLVQLREEIGIWEAKLGDELAGKGESGIAGRGPAADRIEAQELAWRREEARDRSDSISQMTKERNRLFTAINDQSLDEEARSLALARMRAEKEHLEQVSQGQATIRQSVQDQIETTMSRIGELREEISALTNQKNVLTQGPPPADLISQTFALHALFHKEGGQLALIVYVVLSLVFVILDTIPLVAKFSAKSGPYDRLIQQQEFEWEGELDRRKQAAQESEPEPEPVEEKEEEPRPEPEPEVMRPVLEWKTTHPMKLAHQLQELRRGFKTNGELAQYLEVPSATVSKFLKLQKMSEEFQRRLEEIPDLTIENAYRIACVDDEERRQELLALCEAGKSQSHIRSVIKNEPKKTSKRDKGRYKSPLEGIRLQAVSAGE